MLLQVEDIHALSAALVGVAGEHTVKLETIPKSERPYAVVYDADEYGREPRLVLSDAHEWVDRR